MRKPNAARRRGLIRSCSSTTTQARLRRARALHSVSWGATAKRSRPRTGGTAPGSRWWRDWAAGLSDGPAGLIADRLLADDVADYVRFRAACAPWRRCCADPRTRGVLEDPRLYPRHWIMLLDDDDDDKLNRHRCRRFLNTRTGQCVQVDVPELHDDVLIRRATADGLLLLHCERTEAIRLLNPLTRQTAELPPTTGLAGVKWPHQRGSMTSCAAGLLDHATVFLYFRSGPPTGTTTFAIARPGDGRWALLDAGPALMIRDAVFFAGRFYGATTDGTILTVDTNTTTEAAGAPRRLVVAAEGPKPFPFRVMLNDTVHLVDNGGDGGDLRLVHRKLRRVRGYDHDEHYVDKMMYRVYRVNLSTGKTTDRGRRDLGGRAVFIDVYGGGLSVSPRVFPFLRADTIYLGLHCSERSIGNEKIGAYHVRDGSTEPPSPGSDDDDCHRRGLLAHPLSIADTLTAYYVLRTT